MVSSADVTVVVNGAVVAGVAPARLAAGRVVAPVGPIVIRLVSRLIYRPDTASIVLERDGARIVVPVVFIDNDVPYIAIGPVVRDFGGTASFDRRTKTLTVVLRGDALITTPVPFGGDASPVPGEVTFPPVPAAPTPRVPATGVPQPRRTAIPVVPSQPHAEPAETGPPTSRRR